MEKVYRRNLSYSYLFLLLSVFIVLKTLSAANGITGNGWLKIFIGAAIFLYSLWEVITPIAKIAEKELTLKPNMFVTKKYSLAKTSILYDEPNSAFVFTQDGKSFTFKVKLIKSSMKDEFIADIKHLGKVG